MSAINMPTATEGGNCVSARERRFDKTAAQEHRAADDQYRHAGNFSRCFDRQYSRHGSTRRFARYAGADITVNRAGLSDGFKSAQSIGIDTGAPSRARTANG